MDENLDMTNTVNRSRDENIGDFDVGLYLHIPFCAKRCHFCAFYLVMQEERRIERFLRALAIELASYAKQLDSARQRISTVYLGGGTPTALSAVQLSQILTTVRSKFSLTGNCEVTVEATPESLTSAYLDALYAAGVTRLSMGIQTFDQTERTCLGLSSTTEEAKLGIRLLKQSGFTNFNLDVIYGIPGQTILSWDHTLEQACECEPSHLSCYALSVEEGTRFEHAFRRGELKPVETETERQFQVYANEQLAAGGYEHYEISNWAKPGRACRHNQRYWKGQDFLGLGPSAQSYMAGCRFGNVSNLEQYCGRLENGQSAVTEQEFLSISQQEKERVVFGFRMLDGVPKDWVASNARDPDWAALFTAFLEEKYVVQVSDRFALTAKGRQFADALGSQLL